MGHGMTRGIYVYYWGIFGNLRQQWYVRYSYLCLFSTVTEAPIYISSKSYTKVLLKLTLPCPIATMDKVFTCI